MTLILAAIAVIALIVPALDLLRRPVIRRVAMRNLTRRRAEAALVIGGSMLATALIGASAIVGNTFEASIDDIARQELGPIDEVVLADDPALIDQLASVAAGTPGVDGLLTVTLDAAAVASIGEDRRSEPSLRVLEVDLDEARSFGPDLALTGLENAGPPLGSGEVLLNSTVANDLGVSVGDNIDLFAYGADRQFTVRDVLPQRGLAGYAAVIAAPGTFDSMRGAQARSEVPSRRLLVSNDGGLFDSAEASPTVNDALTERFAAAGIAVSDIDIFESKAELLADADAEGAEMTELFTTIGGFSVIAGVLLLVNLFVMLAEERKSELGTLRAVGFRRSFVVRSFVLEGAAYTLAAAVAGTAVAVGVGWVIVKGVTGIIGSDLDMIFTVKPTALLGAAAAGTAISLVTVWLTAWRISRLDIVRAIKDLPEAKVTKGRRALILGGLGMAAGAALTAVGANSAVPAMIGPTLLAFASIPFATRLLGDRLGRAIPAAAAAGWSLAVFTVRKDVMNDPDIIVFLLQGVILVAGAVILTSTADRLWLRLGGLGSGGGLTRRLGFAHPLDRRFRTGLLLAMYALVVFTMTFISVMGAIFNGQADRFASSLGGGYDLVVESNATAPVPTTDLAAEADVAAVAGVRVDRVEIALNGELEDRGAMAIDESFLSRPGPALAERAADYPDDAAAYASVANGERTALVPTWWDVAVGETVVVDPDGAAVELEIIGHLESEFLGLLVTGADTGTELFGPGEPTLHFLAAGDGVAADDLARRLNGSYLVNGADAESFAEIIARDFAQQDGFLSLLRGYLGLGLLIGIGGLGVVMVRAVRERRRQIGTLRALGIQASGVRSIWLTEAGFVAGQGLVLGVGLGLASSWQVMVNAGAFGDTRVDFTVPVLALSVIVGVVLVASIAATAAPARRASRISPAMALRVTD